MADRAIIQDVTVDLNSVPNMVCIHLINNNAVDISVEMMQKRIWKSKGELMKRFIIKIIACLCRITSRDESEWILPKTKGRQRGDGANACLCAKERTL